ncbi:MAG: hypothetical protein ACHQ7N_22170 [Candidatus Methylomirabilales bacterium]
MAQCVGNNGHPGRQGFVVAVTGCKNVVVEVLPMLRGPYSWKSRR